MFKDLTQKHGGQRLGSVANEDRNKIPILVVQNLVQRMLRTQLIHAVPFSERQHSLRRAAAWLAAELDKQQNLEFEKPHSVNTPQVLSKPPPSSGLTPS